MACSGRVGLQTDAAVFCLPVCWFVLLSLVAVGNTQFLSGTLSVLEVFNLLHERCRNQDAARKLCGWCRLPVSDIPRRILL
jgi:hypothetical protein